MFYFVYRGKCYSFVIEFLDEVLRIFDPLQSRQRLRKQRRRHLFRKLDGNDLDSQPTCGCSRYWKVHSYSSAMPPTKHDFAPLTIRQYTVTTSLPLGDILGLAIGGTIFCFVLAISAIYLARRNDRRKRKKLKEDKTETTKETAVPLRTLRIPSRLALKSPYNLLSPDQASAAVPNVWLEDESMMDSPPMTKARARKLSQKGVFQIPRIRDSWPLAASMPNAPLRLLQPHSSMVTLNQVGGGGYVLPTEPLKWPGRTYSRKSTRIVVSAEESNMQRFSDSIREIAPKRPPHQRSASVNQLSTILRSTSQRLKAAHRRGLSRTLTTFGGSMGPPPSDKLTTPLKAGNESQVDLVDSEEDDAETVASSICDAEIIPSPSPTKKDVKNPGQGLMRKRSSATLSVESGESLCAGATPDLVIPVALKSPSKKLTKRNPAFTSPHRTSLESDPFYSAVKSGKRAAPQNKFIGPRPLYMRQTTFGREDTMERPSSFVSASSSPLRRISANIQSSSSITSPIKLRDT